MALKNINIDDLSEIIIKVDNRDEIMILFKIIKENGFSYSGLEREFSNITIYPTFIFINLKDKGIFIWRKYYENEPNENYKQHLYFSLTHDYIYKIKDIAIIDLMLKKRKILPNPPNYAPKNFDRTLESKNSSHEAKEICILIRNEDEFNVLYEAIKPLGYVFTPDYLTNLKHSDSPINIFIDLESGDISQAKLREYELLGQKWTDYPTFNGVWERELTIEELPLILNMLKTKHIAPSYTPKKFIRKLDEEVMTDLSDNLKNCAFFRKYNSFVVISKYSDIKEFYEVMPLLKEVFGIDVPGGVFDYTREDIYIAYRINSWLLESGWGYLKNLDKFNEENYYTCQKFTVKEVNTIDKIRNILRYGEVSPSYKPRKFDRNINESPDWAAFINEKGERELLQWDLPGAYAFGYYKDKMYISPETKGHGSMGPEDERKTKFFNRNDFKFPGRIWTHQKLISFWIYPTKKELDKILIDLSDFINVHFDDPEWRIEIIDEHMVYQNVSISEYTGSKETPYEDLSRQHIISPLLKPKKEVPQGFGSKNPSYQSKRAWDMASLTSESKWIGDFDEKRRQLKKGEYICLCFNLAESEAIEAYAFFEELEIIGEIRRIKTNFQFIILTRQYCNLIPFILYSYGSDLHDIRNHMSKTFGIDINDISPVMSLNQFIGYINRTLLKTAKDMYKPKKMDREI